MNISTDIIKIDGESLDFEGNYSITFSGNDYLNFQPGTAFKSERLVFYNTPKNRRLLNNIFHINADTSNEFEATYISSIITMHGTLKILQANRVMAEGVFYSGNGSLWDDLKGLKLNDLDCSEYNHVLSVSAISDSETYSENNFYVYDFCDRGTRITTGEVNMSERYPAISLRLLLSKIFEGYTLSGDLINETWFKRLFILFSNGDQVENDEAWKASSLFHVGSDSGIVNLSVTGGEGSGEFFITETEISFAETGTGNFDNGGNFASDKYTVPVDGTYKFDFEINATLFCSPADPSVSGSVFFWLMKNGVSILEHEYTILDQPSNPIHNITLTTGFCHFAKDDEITCSFEVAGEFTGTLENAMLTFSTACYLSNSVSRWYGSGSTVDMAYILPDVDILEFLNDFFIYFGLYPLYDGETRTVYLNQLKQTTTVNDITSKIEPRQAVTFEIPEALNYKMKFAEDGNDKYFKFGVENGYFEDGNYEQVETAKENSIIQLKHFANTCFGETGIMGYYSNLCPRLWSEVTGLKYSTKFKLRILYFEGLTDLDYNLNHGVESGVVQTAFDSYPNFTNLSGSVNLNLADVGTVVGMWSNNRRIFDMLNSGKIVTCEVLFSNNDIANLYTCTGNDLRTPVYINNDYINGRFMILKAKQKQGNFFELTLMQKFD